VIGIVTALPEEFAAMQAMINNPRRVAVTHDAAFYVCGALPSASADQPHQVVLTLLGETGSDAAAHACANLVRSFPTVEVILMVGIAAGVPSPADPDRHIRLGDIVVAAWGIVDFDHVVETDSGSTLRQPFPRPSPVLVRCAKQLEVAEQSGKRPWEALADAARARLDGFDRPPVETDAVHASDDPSVVLPHPDPAESRHRQGQPRVHYGRIGSADKSVRSAAARDALAAKYQIRAIEMEGKGLGRAAFASGRDWFVVRGISDYGDRHFNSSWRKYASLVAAAYVSALLVECRPAAVQSRRSRHRRVLAATLTLALLSVAAVAVLQLVGTPGASRDGALASVSGSPNPSSDKPTDVSHSATTQHDDIRADVRARPATGLDAAGSLEVFVRGPDSHLYRVWQGVGQWSGAAAGRGTVIGSPAAGRDFDGRLEVFYRGTDGKLWHQWQDGGRWSAPVSMGVPAAGDPAVGREPDGALDVFFAGSNGHLTRLWKSNGRWGAPVAALGSALTGTPAVGQDADGRPEVFYRGADGKLWHQAQSDGRWNDPISMGVPATSDPAVGTESNGALDLFFAGPDGHLNMLWQGGGQWNGPTIAAGSAVAGTPVVGKNPDQRLEVFYRGTDGNLWHRWQGGGQWNGPESMGVPAAGDPAVGTESNGALDLFFAGPGGHLNMLWQGGGQWNGPKAPV
jgi:nucleoside phosphorylase